MSPLQRIVRNLSIILTPLVLLATVMVGSTLSQSLLTLLVLPVLYRMVHARDAVSGKPGPASLSSA